MSYETKYPDWENIITKASKETNSASAAAAFIGIKVETYKKYAIKYGCYKTNKSGKGISKVKIEGNGKIPLQEILDGKHPQYKTLRLKNRLIAQNILERICSNCGLKKWMGKDIPIELNHINGISSDHSLSNLELLCPNCHAQTDTYRGKNKGINK